MSNKIIEEKKERLNILIENLEQIQLLADTLADNEIPEETEKNRLAQIYGNFIKNESIFNILLSIDDPNCPEMYFEYVGRCIEERLDKCKANSLATRARPQIQQIVQDRSTSLAQNKELLEKNTDIPIIMFDERLTSVISNNILIEADMSRKKRKKKVDSIAAQIILQDYLNKEKNNNYE